MQREACARTLCLFGRTEVKEYFEERRAGRASAQSWSETLYGLKFVGCKGHPGLWHESVRFFDIRDAQGGLVGQFYFDLYARNRQARRGVAWTDVITRRRLASGIQTPVAYMNCNFAGASGGKPALFTHDDVITLFHEFGHGLHHLLTEVVRPGRVRHQWRGMGCGRAAQSVHGKTIGWEWEVLRGMTRHVTTGDPLPRELFDKMLAAKNFQSGLQSLRPDRIFVVRHADAQAT